MKLRTRIVLPLLLTLALLGTVAVASVVRLGEEAAVAEAATDLEGRTVRLADEVNASLESRLEGAALLAFVEAETAFASEVLQVSPEDAAEAQAALAARYRRATLGLFERVVVLDAEGREEAAYAAGAAVPTDPGRDHASEAAFQRYLQDLAEGPLLAVERRADGDLVVAYAAIRDREGALDGVVRGEVPMARVAPAVVEGLRDASAALVTPGGLAWGGSASTAAAAPAGLLAGVESAPWSGVHDGQVVARAPALRPPLASGQEEVWFVVAQRPVASATAPVLQPIYALALALAAVAVAAAAIVAYVVRRSVRPLEQLSRAVAALGSGPPEGHVPPEGPHEVRSLASAFNDLVDRLREREASLAREFESRAEHAKFATLGSLSAGVAHEVKNPLTGMRLQGQLLQRLAARVAAGDGKAAAELVEAAQRTVELNERGLERIEKVVASLTLLAKPRPEVEEVEVAPVVEASIALAGARLRGRAEVHLDIPPGLRALAHTDGLGQVLLNLLTNAAEAVPAQGGRIFVHASRDGSRVRITVADNGPGIPPEVAKRLGEPFFTTKPTGTGLGLSISQRIVRELGGELRSENRREGGARFTVDLPAAPPPSTGPPSRREERPVSDTAQPGRRASRPTGAGGA